MRTRVIACGVTWGLLVLLPASNLPAREDCRACSAFGIQQLREPKAALPFSLKTADGKEASLGDYKGKPVLFLFWASWCESCKEEIDLIEKFSRGKKDQLTIFLVAIDGENDKRIRRIIKNQKITLPVLLDVKEKIARTYGIRVVPTAFLINPEGNIVGTVVGQREWNSPQAWAAVKELFDLH